VKKLLAAAAAGETATGLVLLVYPPIVVQLLFGAEISGAGIVMSRIAGITLIRWDWAAGGPRRRRRAPENAELQPARQTLSCLSGHRW